jgi:hypothetical protein
VGDRTPNADTSPACLRAALEGVHAHLHEVLALSKLREQFSAGAPFTIEYKTGHTFLATDLFANGALMARFESEADAEVLAEFLNTITREAPGRG